MSTDLAVPTNGALALPEHLQQFANAGSGLEGMTQYLQPQWLKVVQDKREEQFKQFEPKTVILIPDKKIIAEPETEIVFTPIMSYDEFICKNPYQMKGTLPFKREASFDPKSDVADKARKLIRFKCPENPKFECVYQTVIHFLFSLQSPAIDRREIVGCSFSGGEFRTGRNLITQLQRMSLQRGQIRMYAFNMRAIVMPHHDKSNNDWYGFDIIGQSADSPFTTVEEYQFFDKQFQFFTENRTNIVSAEDTGAEVEHGEVPTTL